MMIRIDSGPTATVEQLIMAEAWFQLIVERISDNGYEVPRELANQLTETSHLLDQKLRADRQRELAAMKLRREQLLPNNEKLRNLNAEIKALEEKLK